MGTINLLHLIEDANCYLPENHGLSCKQIEKLAQNVINEQIPEDDDQYYSEALCKLLLSSAKLASSLFTIQMGNIRREKVGKVETEYSTQESQKIWDNYMRQLSDICPLLPGGGYVLSRSLGMETYIPKEVLEDNCYCPKSSPLNYLDVQEET